MPTLTAFQTPSVAGHSDAHLAAPARAPGPRPQFPGRPTLANSAAQSGYQGGYQGAPPTPPPPPLPPRGRRWKAPTRRHAWDRRVRPPRRRAAGAAPPSAARRQPPAPPARAPPPRRRPPAPAPDDTIQNSATTCRQRTQEHMAAADESSMRPVATRTNTTCSSGDGRISVSTCRIQPAQRRRSCMLPCMLACVGRPHPACTAPAGACDQCPPRHALVDTECRHACAGCISSAPPGVSGQSSEGWVICKAATWPATRYRERELCTHAHATI